MALTWTPAALPAGLEATRAAPAHAQAPTQRYAGPTGGADSWIEGRVFAAGLSAAALALSRNGHKASRSRLRVSIEEAPIDYGIVTEEVKTDVDTIPPALWHDFADPQDWDDAYMTTKDFGPLVAKVEGTIPRELVGGTFYRAGPGCFERGGVRYNHVIDGDGFVYRFSLDTQDSATATGRFVKTADFVHEEKEDKILYRSTFGTQPSDAASNMFNLHLKNLANTTVLAWGEGSHQRVHALYEAGLPIRLDPADLAIHSVETYDDEMRAGTAVTMNMGSSVEAAFGMGHSHTAHPHIDVWSNRLVSWWYNVDVLMGKCMVTLREWDDRWEAQSTTRCPLQVEMAPHDMCLTPSYVLLCANRLDMSPASKASYMLGLTGPAQTIVVDQGAPNLFHIVRRGVQGDATPLLVETPPWFCIHHSHATEEVKTDGTRILTVYSAGWSEDGLSSGSFLGSWGGHAPNFSVIPVTYYFKTVIAVAADESSASLVSHDKFEGMESACIDHPHVDPRLEASLVDGGRAVKPYCFMSYCNNVGFSSPAIGWMRLDLETGEKEIWQSPVKSGQFSEEVVVVAKESSDGSWVLATQSDARRDQSCLCIFDGDRFAEGPVARVWLPHKLPHGLHGCFVPRSGSCPSQQPS